MIEKEHVLEVLQQAEKAIEKEDILKLKDLSNQTIHSASIYEDTDSILVAVIIYSLSKILERANYREYPSWNYFYKNSTMHLNRSIHALKENDENNFIKELQKVRKDISKLTGNFKQHVQDVFQKASINKASRIYEHGISMSQTANLLGVSIWDLAEYAGRTGIADINLAITLDVKNHTLKGMACN